MRTLARILIVDDQPANIQSLYQVMQQEGEVFLAIGGRQALSFCAKTPPDLILLDVVMPEIDGYEVCRQLKADPDLRDIPVIFVTSHQGAEDEVRALEAGGVDFITKPVNPAVARARVRTHLTLKAQGDMLRRIALVDGLTGLSNRRHFDQIAEKEWRHCLRHQAPLAILMIDVDHFKSYNDTYGHQKGDDCLKAIGVALARNLRRPHDVSARYGGEEFVCLLSETDLAPAVAKAEAIRIAVEQLEIPHSASPDGSLVTVSIGVAAAIPTQSDQWGDLLRGADEALYAAKSSGRNRVVAQSGRPTDEDGGENWRTHPLPASLAAHFE